MIHYAITEGARFGGNFAARRDGLLKDAVRWADSHVEYVQLREKDLGAADLVVIAAAMMEVFRERGGATKLLVNGSVDVALAVDADGVHLTAAKDAVRVAEARKFFARDVVVSVSCHSVENVRRASDADLILFGPVFEKRVDGRVVVDGVGIEALREACGVSDAKVLALGGVNGENVKDCMKVGAAGFAGIRSFQSIIGGS
jgi:thiamine-phosphate pyrophosphorylase